MPIGRQPAAVMVLVAIAMAAGCSRGPGTLGRDVVVTTLAPVPADASGDAAGRALRAVEVDPSPPQPPAPACVPREIVVGHSADGMPLTLYRFGEGEGGTLVIGGIHGNEPTSADVADYLIGHLMERTDPWDGPPLAVLPRANPDGLIRNTRTNARGVDLNRNFAAANWRRRKDGGAQWGGPHPESEPETRAILGAIYLTSPACIISIHSIHGSRQCNNFDGPAKALAEAMAAANGYPVVASLGPCHGSLGNWAGVDRGIPIITLELPRDQPGPDAWEDNREALLLAVCPQTPPSQTAWQGAEAPATSPHASQ